MFRTGSFAVLVVLFLAAVPVGAQPVTVGSLVFENGDSIPFGERTYIDFSNPAIADGTVNRATLRWLEDTGKVCAGSFRVRFFRPGPAGLLGSMTMVADIGPFESRQGLVTVNLGSVAVKKGDLIGLAALLNGCGGIWLANSPRRGDIVYALEGDFKGGVVNTNVTSYNARLSIIAHDSTRYLAGVVPVVGSVDGGFGSKFRTSLVVTNASNQPLVGNLLFHPAGVSGGAGDKSLEFDLAADQSVSFADVVASLGKSGLGSIDVLVTGSLPVVTTSIFDDAGTEGTSGFSQDLVHLEDMLEAGHTGVMPLLTDPANFRMNVGVRTVKATTLYATVYDASGKFVGETTRRTYPALFFEQVALSTFFSGITNIPTGGKAVIVVVSGGPVVLYASTTDNRTNDPRLQMITAR